MHWVYFYAVVVVFFQLNFDKTIVDTGTTDLRLPTLVHTQFVAEVRKQTKVRVSRCTHPLILRTILLITSWCDGTVMSLDPPRGLPHRATGWVLGWKWTLVLQCRFLPLGCFSLTDAYPCWVDALRVWSATYAAPVHHARSTGTCATGRRRRLASLLL